MKESSGSDNVVGLRGKYVPEKVERMSDEGIQDLENFVADVKSGRIVNAFWAGTGAREEFEYGWAIETDPSRVLGEVQLAAGRLMLTVITMESVD